MAAPTFVAVGSVPSNGSNKTSYSPGLPAGITTDDILLCQAGQDSDDTMTMDSDWTKVTPDIVSNGRRRSLWWHRHDGTTPSNTITIGAGRKVTCVISAWRGCITTGTPYESMGTDHNTADSDIDYDAFTTTGADRTGVRIAANHKDHRDPTSVPSGWTERLDFENSDGFALIDSKEIATATTEAAGTRVSDRREWGSWSFALIPAASGSTHDLTAQDIESTSEVTSATIGQTHALTAVDIESTAEISSATLGQVHALTASDIEASSEITSATLSESHSLTAQDIEATSEVTSASIGQVHALTASDIESATEVESATLGQVHALTASDIEASAEISTATLGQVHALTAVDIEATSEVTSATLSESVADHNLVAQDIEAQAEITSASLGQVHALVANDITSTSEIEAATLGQVHNLVALDIEAASEITSATAAVLLPTPTPAERTFTVDARKSVVSVPRQSRTAEVPSHKRTVSA